MDTITKQVAEQYQAFPFPNSKEDIDFYAKTQWFQDILKFFSTIHTKTTYGFLENSAILEVGCGTGPTISKIAQLFPSCIAMGMDIANNALEQAKKIKKIHNINNLKFIEGNILTMDLNQKFDVILAIGVLHHLPNIKLGLQRLLKHLDSNGYLVVWLYGEYGRHHLTLNQKFLKSLFSSVSDLKTKVELTKKILSNCSLEYLACHIDTPSQIKSDFGSYLDYILHNEAWLVDQLLHVYETTFTMDKILNLITEEGLRLVQWLGVSENISSYIEEPEIIQQFNSLPKNDQLRTIDLLIKPNFYCIVLAK